MTPTQLQAISRSFRTERSLLEASQAQARRSRRLVAASRRAHRRAVRQMAEAFGVGETVSYARVQTALFGEMQAPVLLRFAAPRMVTL